MKLFDEQRICHSGLNIRDLALTSVIVFLGNSLLWMVFNLLRGTESVWQDYLDTRFAQVELVARFLAIPLLGLLASVAVRGRYRVVAQGLAILFFHGIVAYTVARLVVR